MKQDNTPSIKDDSLWLHMNRKKQHPFMAIFFHTAESEMFRGHPILHLLIELRINAPDWPHFDAPGKIKILYPPRRGVFKPGVIANRLHHSKATIRRWFRMLKKEKFVIAYSYHYYTEYYLTDGAFPVFSEKDVIASSIPPSDTPSDPMSISRNLSISKTKVPKTMPATTFKISRSDQINHQRLVMKALCGTNDTGLNDEAYRWLRTGICCLNNFNCKAAEGFCMPWIEKLSAKIIKYTYAKGKPIQPGRERKYIEIMLSEISSKKGGD